MDELEIKIVLSYKVPKKNNTIRAFLSSLFGFVPKLLDRKIWIAHSFMSLRGAKRRGNPIINNMLRLPRYARNDNFFYEIAMLPMVASNGMGSSNFGTKPFIYTSSPVFGSQMTGTKNPNP